MALTVCLYEDSHFCDFYPLTHLHPVYGLRAGIVPLYERVGRYFDDCNLFLCCREQLSPVLAARQKDYPVNFVKKGESDVLLLNGRIRDFGDLPRLVAESRISTLFSCDGQPVAMLLKVDGIRSLSDLATPVDYDRHLKAEGENIPEFHTTATLYSRAWEIMADIEREIKADFEWLLKSTAAAANVRVHDGVGWVNQDDVYLGNGVEILPGAVLDASAGPIYIADNVKVEPHAAIYGPTYVGPNSVILAGKISASSIGHTCRVGGEVENSVFQAYVNKYHAGFIGHSYVGEWVNFGAMTTNSDLKNNYSNIRVTVNSESIDTGSIKVGSFIGDHTKFGIGMLLNTGINIGVSCNIFGGGLVTDKEVPSFSWGSTGSWVPFDVEKAIASARVIAGRRNYALTDHEEHLLRAIAKGESDCGGTIDLAVPNESL